MFYFLNNLYWAMKSSYFTTWNARDSDSFFQLPHKQYERLVYSQKRWCYMYVGSKRQSMSSFPQKLKLLLFLIRLVESSNLRKVYIQNYEKALKIFHQDNAWLHVSWNCYSLDVSFCSSTVVARLCTFWLLFIPIFTEVF